MPKRRRQIFLIWRAVGSFGRRQRGVIGRLSAWRWGQVVPVRRPYVIIVRLLVAVIAFGRRSVVRLRRQIGGGKRRRMSAFSVVCEWGRNGSRLVGGNWWRKIVSMRRPKLGRGWQVLLGQVIAWLWRFITRLGSLIAWIWRCIAWLRRLIAGFWGFIAWFRWFIAGLWWFIAWLRWFIAGLWWFIAWFRWFIAGLWGVVTWFWWVIAWFWRLIAWFRWFIAWFRWLIAWIRRLITGLGRFIAWLRGFIAWLGLMVVCGRREVAGRGGGMGREKGRLESLCWWAMDGEKVGFTT